MPQSALRRVASEHLRRCRMFSAQQDWASAASTIEDLRAAILQLHLSVPEVVLEFRNLIDDRQWEFGQDVVTAASFAPSPEYVPLLCEILDMECPDAPNESIVDFMAELQDARCVRALENALSFRDRSDPGLQVPIRALNALAMIGTAEAIAAIETATRSEERSISREAAGLLKVLRDRRDA